MLEPAEPGLVGYEDEVADLSADIIAGGKRGQNDDGASIAGHEGTAGGE
jgi:hypothetical protein